MGSNVKRNRARNEASLSPARLLVSTCCSSGSQVYETGTCPRVGTDAEPCPRKVRTERLKVVSGAEKREKREENRVRKFG